MAELSRRKELCT